MCHWNKHTTKYVLPCAGLKTHDNILFCHVPCILPCVFLVAHDKLTFCHVPMLKHTAKCSTHTHGKLLISGRDGITVLNCSVLQSFHLELNYTIVGIIHKFGAPNYVV